MFLSRKQSERLNEIVTTREAETNKAMSNKPAFFIAFELRSNKQVIHTLITKAYGMEMLFQSNGALFQKHLHEVVSATDDRIRGFSEI